MTTMRRTEHIGNRSLARLFGICAVALLLAFAPAMAAAI